MTETIVVPIITAVAGAFTGVFGVMLKTRGEVRIKKADLEVLEGDRKRVGAEDLRAACGGLILAFGDDHSYSERPEKDATKAVKDAAAAIESDSPYRAAADQLEKAIAPDLPRTDALKLAEEARRSMGSVTTAA